MVWSSTLDCPALNCTAPLPFRSQRFSARFELGTLSEDAPVAQLEPPGQISWSRPGGAPLAAAATDIARPPHAREEVSSSLEAAPPSTPPPPPPMEAMEEAMEAEAEAPAQTATASVLLGAIAGFDKERLLEKALPTVTYRYRPFTNCYPAFTLR